MRTTWPPSRDAHGSLVVRSLESRFDSASYDSQSWARGQVRPAEGGTEVTEGLWCEERLLVDGRLVAAASGATYDDVNPATEGLP
jgi:hypothetical protein